MSSSSSRDLNPRCVPSVSRYFTVNASYTCGVTSTSSGKSSESGRRRFFGDRSKDSNRPSCRPLSLAAEATPALDVRLPPGGMVPRLWRVSHACVFKTFAPLRCSCPATCVTIRRPICAGRRSEVRHDEHVRMESTRGPHRRCRARTAECDEVNGGSVFHGSRLSRLVWNLNC